MNHSDIDAQQTLHIEKNQKDAALLQKIMSQSKMTQRLLTEIIGLGGANNDGKAVRRILEQRQGLSGPSRRLLAIFIKNGSYLPKAEEEKIIEQFLAD